MIMNILLTIWVSLFFLGLLFLATAGLLNEYEIGEVFYNIFHVLACCWLILTFLGVFVFFILLVWS